LNGKIHSRFQNAINIKLDDGFIFNLLPDGIPPNPRSLNLQSSDWKGIQKMSLSVGTQTNIKEGKLEIPEIALKISFTDSIIWDPKPSLSGSPVTDAEIFNKLEILAMAIQKDDEKSNDRNRPIGNIQSISKKKQSQEMPKVVFIELQNRILKAANDLYISISNRNFEGISQSSYQLVGLGPGLTPSGDDVLSGVMAAGVYCSLAYKALDLDIKKINKQICTNALGRTTIFSQMLLLDSSIGEVVHPLGVLIKKILCFDGKKSFAPLTNQIMTLGESSGKDMLVGTILGMKAFLRLRYKIR
jgi:hypothetical protein